MGWEYVTYNGRAEMVHDLHLWTLRHFLMNAAGSLATGEPAGGPYSQAHDFFASWQWPGPGVVTGTRFDDFVLDRPEKVAILARVLERAAVQVREFGGRVPLDYLETHINATSPGGVYTAEVPSQVLLQAIARLLGMLKPLTPSSEES